ncbi:RabGAP/TBC [Dissoconium aciculare CBS 342.82]|uniref:RabGAP/TBC n=1 Tax=Dissoconium aciculare CBS 342.82 TaxID=1314786 RepID=A0A6J3M8Q7_9PEZI|nr:RabGAP/TBC [Dissoconium aciculare CBS 342.82]KAF1824380.1 RabGAP/TBC [Dissoconium aciculare CBS 342.82]
MSWQPGRKTVEQLEAEYNDDEDDEVPDEAILENVPMSPMPGHQQNYLRSPSTHSLRSTTPSPHRRPSYANLHSANIPKNARRPSAPPTTHPHSRTPRSPHRSKSWSDDLNLEAKRLSQALEVYAEKAAQDPAPASNRPMSLTAPKSPLRATFSKRNKSVAEIPTFPPIQTSVVTLDPIPISKEKEAVLTRTRPSWLPPKSKKEEKRHLKEFQQMMARAAEAEKKRAAKDQEAQETREEMQDSIARIWEQHVLPNWDAVVREPRTRELWWRGVTPHNRGQVWSRAIGNELELTAASYSAALSRAHTLESSISTLPVEDRAHHKEAAWFDAITRDVPNVLPEERVFQMGGRLHAQLRDVLKAYAMYRSDVGYVYGTHLIAGLLVLYLPNDPAAAFVVLANMLNRPLPLAFLVHDPVAMARTHELVLSTLRYKFPSLHDHLTSSALGLQPDEYLDPLFRCLFAYNLPSSHVARIWDLYAFEGDRALIRAAVAVLGCLESKLYGSKEEVLNVISWRCEAAWDLGDEEVFVKAVREAGKVDGKGGEN